MLIPLAMLIPFQIQDAVDRSVQASARGAHQTEQAADAEMARIRRALAEIDRLEDDVERIKNIREKVKLLRVRVDRAGDSLERSQPTGSGHGDRHGSSRHDRHGSRR